MKYTAKQLQILNEMTFDEMVKDLTGFTVQEIKDHANCEEGFVKVLKTLCERYNDIHAQFEEAKLEQRIKNQKLSKKN